MCVCVIVSASVLPYLNIGVNIQTCGDIFLAESGTCVVLKTKFFRSRPICVWIFLLQQSVFASVSVLHVLFATYDFCY